MSEKKIVKTVTEAAIITGLVSGIGFLSKKILKESFTNDPSLNFMNYGKMTVVVAASMMAKDYLEVNKIIPIY